MAKRSAPLGKVPCTGDPDGLGQNVFRSGKPCSPGRRYQPERGEETVFIFKSRPGDGTGGTGPETGRVRFLEYFIRLDSH